jgi:hypothetical protein
MSRCSSGSLRARAPRFRFNVHPTDAERDWAYDQHPKIGKPDKALDEGQKRGWTIVDLRRQWTAVFAFDE